MRIAFVTNFCPHYRVKTFEMLARYYDVDYYFFSAGDEWYWLKDNGTGIGAFRHQYLRGFRLGRTRVTPTLIPKLLSGQYDVYVKCINGRFALPATYLVSRLRHKPFVLVTDTWVTLQTKFHRLIFPLTRHIYLHADAIVAHGEHIKRYLVEVGVQPGRIFVAPHAVDNEKYSCRVPPEEIALLRDRLGIPPHHRVILYLGRLEASKGLTYLLDAFASLRCDDVSLVIVGSGSELSSLQARAQANGIADRVRFAGYARPNDTICFYAMASLCVVPSITTSAGKEPWGLVVNEAFNQGVPVIATDAVGAAAGGLVQDGVNGFVVPERDSDALARALKVCLDDTELREKMSKNAREIISSWDNAHMVLGFRQAIEYVEKA